MPTEPSDAAGSADLHAHDHHRLITALEVVGIVAVGLVIWFLPTPEGVDERGMAMLGIFVATILGLILQPLPTAAVAIVGLAVAMITGTMDPETEALAGFSSATIWLIVAAFFIAEGFLITGLGRRIALIFIARVGGSSLGLAYGLALTDLVLAPATPSNTARAGGVIYPIVASVSAVRDSTPDSEESRRRLGAFLAMSAVQVNLVTSAMFITAMAANPLAQDAAAAQGIDISWAQWAAAAAVPGLVSLIAVPWVVSRLYPPTVRRTPEAPGQAREELRSLGGLKRAEWVMAATFVLLLVLWCLGEQLDVNATAAAFLGVAVLLVTKVLRWKDLAENTAAWSTLIFFAVLVGMADQLNALGVIDWVGNSVADSVDGLGWAAAFAILTLVYFYVHYLFASNTAQVVAMYAVFLGAAVATGAPATLAALVLGFIGNLFGGLAHYSSGPAGVIYGSGYVRTTEWFRVGFLVSLVLILIWTVVGAPWMKLVGVW